MLPPPKVFLRYIKKQAFTARAPWIGTSRALDAAICPLTSLLCILQQRALQCYRHYDSSAVAFAYLVWCCPLRNYVCLVAFRRSAEKLHLPLLCWDNFLLGQLSFLSHFNAATLWKACSPFTNLPQIFMAPYAGFHVGTASDKIYVKLNSVISSISGTSSGLSTAGG